MRKNKKIFLLVPLFLAFYMALLFGGSGRELFIAANKYYVEKKYEAALRLYKKIIDSGYESGELYYNMGNSALKLGRRGEAVLYYEKALKFMPHDSDLKSNLKYALSGIKQANIDEKTTFKKALFDLSNVLSYNEIAIFFTFSLLAFAAAFLLYFYRCRASKKCKNIFLTALLFFLAVSFLFAAKVYFYGHEAVVLKDNSEVRFAPMDEATVHYTAYEGSKLLIVKKKDGWYKVVRGDGLSGWIKSGDVGII